MAFEPIVDPDPGMPGEPGTGEEDEQGRPDGPAADAERAEKGPAEDERVRDGLNLSVSLPLASSPSRGALGMA